MRSHADITGEALATVERHGHGCLGVFAAEGQDTPVGGGYTYTYGASASYGLPEFVVVGAPSDTAAFMLNALYAQAREHDWNLDAGERLTLAGFGGSFSDGLPVLVAEVPDEWRRDGGPFAMTRRLYDRDGFRARQLVWCDTEGRLPGDEGWDPMGQVLLRDEADVKP